MDAKRAEEFLRQYELLSPDWAKEYFRIHARRFQKTLEAIPEASSGAARAIEFGTYGLFPLAMVDIGNYETADGTTWERSPHKTYSRTFEFDRSGRQFRMFDVNLERENLPIESDYYDFVLCAEVIEHMSTDPMAVFIELNRVLKVGGVTLVTTPNVACASNIRRILERKVPNSYYQYRKARDTDRHNLEYSPDLLIDTLSEAGFRVINIWTEQCWNTAEPDIHRLLNTLGYTTSLRDDNIFALAEKISQPNERFPSFLYD